MVFQNYALFPHMTVAENIAFPLTMRKLDAAAARQRALQALELVRLPQVAQRYPKELSGGQQQRIALARCLVYRPAIVLMDEPLGALDKKLRDHMQLEIKRIRALDILKEAGGNTEGDADERFTADAMLMTGELALLTAALNGSLRYAQFRTDKYFGFAVPTSLTGVEPHLLDPNLRFADILRRPVHRRRQRAGLGRFHPMKFRGSRQGHPHRVQAIPGAGEHRFHGMAKGFSQGLQPMDTVE